MSRSTRPSREGPRRVLVVEPAGQLYGSERVLLDALDGLGPLPWHVGVCLPPGTPLVERLRARPVEVFPTLIAELHHRGKPARLLAAFGLLRAALAFRPDLLYVNQAGATRLALVVARVLRVPVVTHVRLAEDVAYLEALAPSRRAVPTALCVSEDLRSRFTPGGPLSPDRLVTLYDPFALPDLPTGPTASGVRFVCVGRLARQKGQDVLLHGWQAYQDDAPEAELAIVGAPAAGDPFEDELRALAARLGVAPRWVGFDPDPARFLVGATALVCPSWYETLGRVLFEAWGAGTVPIVWAGAGGAAEVVRASGGGVLYDEQSGEGLAKALREAEALSPGERARMVERGRSWVQGACDPSAHAARLAVVWNDALSPVRSPHPSWP